MGIQTMGSQGGGDSNGKQSQFQPLARQSSMYSLTLDEVQNQLGDLGKPLSSMNLDELLKNVWIVEANQSSVGMDVEGNGGGTQLANQTVTLQHQASISLTSALSKKTVDEVWRDIQQKKDANDGDKMKKPAGERQSTLGEMTLEDFLVKAGVVAEAEGCSGKKSSMEVVEGGNVGPQFLGQAQQWVQFPQQSMMGVYIPGQPMHMDGGGMEVVYGENPVGVPSPLMGTLSDSQMVGRKRGNPEEIIEKTVERRQKRMIKNRESAARSRARKQAYTTELENKVSRLEEENERLSKQKELEKMLTTAPPPEPKYQLRRTASSPL